MWACLLYIELTISFPIGRKRAVSFRNQRLWRHLAADETIVISRTVKVTGNYVTYDAVHDFFLLFLIVSRIIFQLFILQFCLMRFNNYAHA